MFYYTYRTTTRDCQLYAFFIWIEILIKLLSPVLYTVYFLIYKFAGVIIESGILL